MGGASVSQTTFSLKNQNILGEHTFVSKVDKFSLFILRGLLKNSLLMFHLEQTKGGTLAPFPYLYQNSASGEARLFKIQVGCALMDLCDLFVEYEGMPVFVCVCVLL